MESNILVTGAGSGLGKGLCDYFKGVGFLRTTPFAKVMDQANHRPFRAIIHAAFNPRQDITSAELSSYLNDTILLTKKLLQIPHQHFIFISSGDVYPKESEGVHREEDDISLQDVDSIYGIAKLISESMIKEEAKKFLILRPTALLGHSMRKNSLIKILTEEHTTLTLSGQSTFNYVLHSDLIEFVEKALNLQLTGTYNIAASSNVSLGEAADFFKRPVHFGKYIYRTGHISNDKAVSVLSHFNKTSLENIVFYREKYLI